MLNTATFKVRIDKLQAYLSEDQLSVQGYLSFKFRDRQEERIGQIEFAAKSKTATQLQEAGIGAVGIAIGRLDTYPNQPNVRIIFTILQWEPIAANQPQVPVATPAAARVQTPVPTPIPVPQPQVPVAVPAPVPVPVAAAPIATIPAPVLGF